MAQFKKGSFWPLGLVAIGVFLLAYFFWPTVSWYLKFHPQVQKNHAKDSQPQVAGYSQEGIVVQKNADGFSYFVTMDKSRSYSISEFTISVPKLDIKDAKVEVDSLDFQKNLAHLPGSALPGEVGNVFITGHSVLPQFFSPDNYLTIFSTLPKLEIGDLIEAQTAGVIWQYRVVKTSVVDPLDLSVILPPKTDGRFLSLMTCVPPGLSSKRLVATGKLVEGGEN